MWQGGEDHLYLNHLDLAREQLTRTPRPPPPLEVNKRGSVFDYRIEDLNLAGYDPHPHIPAPVAVWTVTRDTAEGAAPR